MGLVIGIVIIYLRFFLVTDPFVLIEFLLSPWVTLEVVDPHWFSESPLSIPPLTPYAFGEITLRMTLISLRWFNPYVPRNKLYIRYQDLHLTVVYP